MIFVRPGGPLVQPHHPAQSGSISTSSPCVLKENQQTKKHGAGSAGAKRHAGRADKILFGGSGPHFLIMICDMGVGCEKPVLGNFESGRFLHQSAFGI